MICHIFASHEYDESGNIVKQCNLIKENWESIISEEVWWLAYNIRKGKAAEYVYSKRGNVYSGLRESIDIIAAVSETKM